MLCSFIELVRFARWGWRLVHMTDEQAAAEVSNPELTETQRACVRDELMARAEQRLSTQS